jgi:hypothetical protein
MILYKLIWRPEKKESAQKEKNQNPKLAFDWEVSEELNNNLSKEEINKKYSSPAIEAITPSIEFFQSHDYPELADYELETTFNQNRITALVRDPYWIYLYWEINKPFNLNGKPVLKVLDIKNKNYPHSSANNSFITEIDLEAKNWCLKLPAANRRYVVELGLLEESGEFNLIARSNYFTTPRDRPSDKYDPEWMTIDGIFKRSYKHPNPDGTFNTGSSPFGKGAPVGVGEEYISSPMYGEEDYSFNNIEDW